MSRPKSECRHCERVVYLVDGYWIDPKAQGDDSIWRETCDAHDTFVAEHEPALDWCETCLGRCTDESAGLGS